MKAVICKSAPIVFMFMARIVSMSVARKKHNPFICLARDAFLTPTISLVLGPTPDRAVNAKAKTTPPVWRWLSQTQ